MMNCSERDMVQNNRYIRVCVRVERGNNTTLRIDDILEQFLSLWKQCYNTI